MAAKETGDGSDLHECLSSVTAPKTFHGQMELIEEPAGVAQPPERRQVMHVAEYGHRLHETSRRHRSNAVGAPSSYDERHPSVDVHATTTVTSAVTTTASPENEGEASNHNNLYHCQFACVLPKGTCTLYSCSCPYINCYCA